jgi:hypothetical protein
MMVFVGSGVVCGQSVEDTYNEFWRNFYNEFFESEEQHQRMLNTMALFRVPLDTETRQATIELQNEQIRDLDRQPTADDWLKIGIDISFDADIAMQQKLMEKEREVFPEALKMQQRNFQLNESLMRRLESFRNPDDAFFLSKWSRDLSTYVYSQDFLELTAEQSELIKAIQKETVFKLEQAKYKSRVDHLVSQSEKMMEHKQLMEKYSQAKTNEELMEIHKMMRKIEEDMEKDANPQMLAILIEGRESYMRVLTDAQKAKIAAVMADMPDYMKNLFAAIDREGGGLSILHNWQPGMGVPGVNPNHEAPRERRESTGGRTFPGN